MSKIVGCQSLLEKMGKNIAESNEEIWMRISIKNLILIKNQIFQRSVDNGGFAKEPPIKIQRKMQRKPLLRKLERREREKNFRKHLV